MKRYSEYKEVECDWFFNIPENWDTIKIKYLDNSNETLFLDGDWIESKVIKDDGIRYLTTGNIGPGYYKEQGRGFISPETFKILNCTEVFPGDLVASRLNKPIGRACIIPDLGYRIIVAVDNVIIRPKMPFSRSYLMYVMNNIGFSSFTDLVSRGATMQRISRGQLGRIKIPFPSGVEQTQIANYLDHQTGLIDAIIEKKELLLKKLKEQRQAIINEGVTKGLNSNPKMKNSGIEWLGEIPEHWMKRDLQTVVLKNQYSLTGGPFGSDLKHEEYTEEGVQIIQLNNIGVGEFKNYNKIYTSDEKANQLLSCNIYPGDLIIAKMADPVARACVMPDFNNRYLMASDGIRLEVDKSNFNTKFLEYAINSNYFNLQAEMNSTGTTRLRIGLTTLRKLKLVTPDISEQDQIVDYLEDYNNNFQLILTKTKTQIDRLKTYRQSIISEAVTGKIDVREWEPKTATKV